MRATLATDALIAAPPSVSSKKSPAVRTLEPRWAIALVIGDLLAFLLSSAFGVVFVQHYWNGAIQPEHAALSAAVFVTLWLVVFELLGLYRRSYAMSVRDEFYHTIAALSMGVAPIALLFTILPSVSTSRAALIASLVASIVLVGGYRVLTHFAYVATHRRERRVVLVGRAERLDDLIETVRNEGTAHVYWLAVPDLDATLAGVELFGPNAFNNITWLQQALEYGANDLVFTEILPPSVVPHLLAAAQPYGIRIAFAPPRIKSNAYTLATETVGNQTLIIPSPLPACTPTGRLAKRTFDIAVALGALVIFAPVMLVIAFILSFDRSGPLLYRQQRVGRDGKLFDILKFRSMRTDAERDGARFAVIGDARTTKIGRFLRRTSLDELPQLFNVLRGDMSIVGPRPERPVFVNGFRSSVARYDERHLVKPGLTALSHVEMKRVQTQDDVHEKLRYDLFYIENWSPFLDLSIVVKTGAEFLFHRAA